MTSFALHAWIYSLNSSLSHLNWSHNLLVPQGSCCFLPADLTFYEALSASFCSMDLQIWEAAVFAADPVLPNQAPSLMWQGHSGCLLQSEDGPPITFLLENLGSETCLSHHVPTPVWLLCVAGTHKQWHKCTQSIIAVALFCSICFRAKISMIQFILAFNMLCASTSHLLLNFHFNFLADYLYEAICRVTYFLILSDAPTGCWKVSQLIVEFCPHAL